MSEELRDILERVSRGELSPEEAAERLDGLEDLRPEIESKPESTVRRIRVVGDYRSASITGDPSVREAVAEGPHSARREGDTLVIDASSDAGERDDFSFSGRERRGILVSLGARTRPQPISVRMNPDLPLEIRVDAGAVQIKDVRAPICGDVDAGAIRIDGFASPFDLRVDAGSVTASGVLDHGEAKVTCNAGMVKIRLRKGSNVRVRAHADVGRVTIGGKVRGEGVHIGGEPREKIFGDGDATLTIKGGIGRISVEEE